MTREPPSHPVSPGTAHAEPSDDEVEAALAFAPERHPEKASTRRKLAALTGVALAASAGVLAYIGYGMGGLGMAFGLVFAALVATMIRLTPSLLAARERKQDRERARQIATARKLGLTPPAPPPLPLSRDRDRRGAGPPP